MATGRDYSSLFSSRGLKWTGQRVVFHRTVGENVRLSETRTLATRVRSWSRSIVCTIEPVPIGQMFKVTVTEKKRTERSLIIAGLQIGLTGGNPERSTLTQRECFIWESGDEDLLCIEAGVWYNDKKLCDLGFLTWDLTVGQSLGMLLTRQGDLHWFLDDEWKGVVHVDGYPLDKPMWGVADVHGKCEQVTAEILTVSKYEPSSESQLLEMGLIKPAAPLRPAQPQPDQPPLRPAQPQPDQGVLVQQLLQEQESLRQQVQRKDGQFQQLKQDLTRERSQLTSTSQQLTQANQSLSEQSRTLQLQLTQTRHYLTQEIHGKDGQLQQLQQELARQRAAADTEIQQLRQQLTQANHQLAERNERNRALQQQLTHERATIEQLDEQNRFRLEPVNSHELEFWQVSPEEVSIRIDQILGTGAWGYVAKGTFRGTPVAVKCVHRAILQQTTLERIRREIRTMAQIRHPNLVLLIAAVLDEQTGPMIVIELLDTSLRAAYQANRIGTNKRKIFGDVSSALVYLHRQREPIIHRDLNSANVLLASLPNDTWLAKLSDFGSANLAQYATTLGEGAILYTAPEAFPQHPTSPRPRLPQTTKIDVYSFGVVACEVVTGVFPEAERFPDLLSSVGRVWPQIHPLITSCVSHSPQDRPTMDTVLSQVKQLDSEP